MCLKGGKVSTSPRFYVNNKELLEQIHLSKTSFCTFRNKELDNRFDAVVMQLDEINEEVIEAAKKTRATRLKLAGEETSIDDIALTDLVFRVMTYEHIPLAPPKPPKNLPKKQNLSELFDFEEEDVASDDEPVLSKKHIRPNFPPFYHYRIDDNGEYFIVGKSHWKGELDDGEFCKTHGQFTEKLAKMFLMMTERYSSRGNWRSYTYLEEMKGSAIISLLSGGLQFNEAKSSNPFSFYTTIITNAFTAYLLVERKNQNIRDDLLEANGLNPSFTRQFANSYNFADKHGPVEIIKYDIVKELDDE